MSHREITRLVDDQSDCGGWWAQSVTVGYERIKGLRDVGQRRGGTYDASKSKTLPVPIAELYRAWSEPGMRRHWLGDVAFEVRRANREKSLRLTWGDGTSVTVYFWVKGDEKSQVAIQHSQLASRSEVERMKSF